ncbi:ferredoxin reductase family protein [Micromonospora auratinigra]|uniref:ferredoxin reductase family protein n=1 Tax=Micromonospora auratinigra TaxID=261654 RepID=UPI001E461BE2|nr:ferredoxin reductase family protein [Micromonospora auratinigra]
MLWTCLAANVLIVESLFFLGPSGKNELLSIARFVGLHAALLTMLQLVLVARIPYLDRRLGMDRLTLWHRWNGFGLLWLVVTHGLLVVLGYAALDGAPAARTLMALAGVPASLLGMLATAVIVLVAVTSVRWMRKRLPYELWHAVHILLYVALVLALLHQALETTTLAGPLPGAYWWAMWVAVGTALVYGRVVVPLWRNLRHGFRVAAVVPEAGNAVSVYVTGRRLDRLPARAGQFAIWRFFEHNFWWTANPFSLSAMPDGRTLRLTAKAVGRTSAGLRQLPVGTRVFIEGPYGAFTGAAKVRRDTLLVAGGVGITPVRALLEELGGSVTVLYRVRSEAEASLLGEVRNLARSRGARLHLLAGPTAPPISAALIANLVPDVAGRDVFVCGPPGMNMLVLKALRQLGVPRSQVHWERFGLG